MPEAYCALTGEASDGGRRDKKGLKKEMKEACRGGVREKKRYKKDISKGGEVIDVDGDDEVENPELGHKGLFFCCFYMSTSAIFRYSLQALIPSSASR